MMGNILKYEFIKLAKRRSIIIIIAIAVLFNIYVFYRDDFSKWFNEEYYKTENAEYIDGYEEFRENINSQADRLLTVSIFGITDSFSKENILKTVKDYDALGKVTLSDDTTPFAKSVSGYTAINIFIALAAIVITYAVYGSEDVKSEKSLALSTTGGRKYLIKIKMLTTIIWTVIIAVIMMASVFIMAAIKYGISDLSASIQSLQYFQLCTAAISIGGFLIRFCLIKLLGAVVLSVLLSFIFTLFDNAGIAGIVSALIVGAEYIAYTVLETSSPFACVKFLNVFSVLDSGNWYSYYLNLKMFGRAVDGNTSRLLFSLILIILSVTGVFLLSKKSAAIRFRIKLDKLVFMCRRFVVSKIVRLPLGLQEFVRIFFNGAMWIVIVLTVMVGVNKLQSFDDGIYDYGKAAYSIALKDMEGVFTPDILKFYDEKKQEDILYQNASYVMDQQVTFCIEQYGKIDDIGIINNYFVEEFTSNPYDDIDLIIYFILLITPVLAVIFAGDYRNGMRKLIRVNANGGKVFFRKKYAIGIIFIVFAAVCIYGSFYCNIFREYKNLHTEVAVQSMYYFQNAGYTMTVKGFIILTGIYTAIGLIAGGVIIMMLSIFVKRSFITIVASAAFFFIPALLKKAYIDVGYFGLNPVALVRNMSTVSLAPVMIYLLILVAIAVLMTVVGYRKYERE